MALLNFRKIDIIKQDGKRKIIDTFINAIYVSNDDFKIYITLTEKRKPLNLKNLKVQLCFQMVHQQKESSTNSTAFFLPFRRAERFEPAVQPPGRRAPPFWRLLPPFPPLSGGIYLLSAPKRTLTQTGRRSFCVFKNDRT